MEHFLNIVTAWQNYFCILWYRVMINVDFLNTEKSRELKIVCSFIFSSQYCCSKYKECHKHNFAGSGVQYFCVQKKQKYEMIVHLNLFCVIFDFTGSIKAIFGSLLDWYFCQTYLKKRLIFGKLNIYFLKPFAQLVLTERSNKGETPVKNITD